MQSSVAATRKDLNRVFRGRDGMAAWLWKWERTPRAATLEQPGRSGVEHHQRGRHITAEATARGACDSGAVRGGQRFPAVRSEAGGAGRQRARRKALVAVARKLAVLLDHLWATGEVRTVAEPSSAGAGGRRPQPDRRTRCR